MDLDPRLLELHRPAEMGEHPGTAAAHDDAPPSARRSGREIGRTGGGQWSGDLGDAVAWRGHAAMPWTVSLEAARPHEHEVLPGAAQRRGIGGQLGVGGRHHDEQVGLAYAHRPPLVRRLRQPPGARTGCHARHAPARPAAPGPGGPAGGSPRAARRARRPRRPRARPGWAAATAAARQHSAGVPARPERPPAAAPGAPRSAPRRARCRWSTHSVEG